MCGIAGFLSENNNIDNKILFNMLDEIKHRGPDAQGIYVNKNIRFGHKRLIVIDPDGGAQPMIYKNQKGFETVIIYNGEIYNTQEVKKKLINLGAEFKTNCDTEIVLNSYVYLGSKSLDYLNGIFAFAIYDQEKQKIFLARDRFGVKPLFYYYDNNKKDFVFASEIKSIFKFPGIKKNITRDSLREILTIGPIRMPNNKIFDNINELEPGYFLELENNNLKKSCYFKLKYEPHKENLKETADHVYYLLNKAIKNQLNSDVPLGTFLSGGLDSSIISAIAKKNIKDLNTFSLSFKNNNKYFSGSVFQPDRDDLWVKKVKDFIKSNHHEIILDPIDTAKTLEKAMQMRDFPGMADIDSSLLLFCEQIKKHVTVALSGECADEIFGGYPWFYRDDLNLNKNNYFPWIQDISIRESILKINLDLKNYAQEKYLEAIKNAPEFPEDDPQEKKMRDLFYLNINYFMANLLERKDRMSMANGLEVRVPFCDHELIQYVFNIPWRIKFYNNQEKAILRLALENKNLLPKEIIWRKKSPYPKTYDPAYTELVCDMLKTELKNNNLLSEIINTKKLFDLAKTKTPWFGQLMSGPQLIGYFFQLSRWLKI